MSLSPLESESLSLKSNSSCPLHCDASEGRLDRGGNPLPLPGAFPLERTGALPLPFPARRCASVAARTNVSRPVPAGIRPERICATMSARVRASSRSPASGRPAGGNTAAGGIDVEAGGAGAGGEPCCLELARTGRYEAAVGAAGGAFREADPEDVAEVEGIGAVKASGLIVVGRTCAGCCRGRAAGACDDAFFCRAFVRTALTSVSLSETSERLEDEMAPSPPSAAGCDADRAPLESFRLAGGTGTRATAVEAEGTAALPPIVTTSTVGRTK